VTDPGWFPYEKYQRNTVGFAPEEAPLFQHVRKDCLSCVFVECRLMCIGFQVTLEDYCSRAGTKIARKLYPRLRDAVLQQVQEAMTRSLGEIDALVLELCETGKLNKCCLMEMEAESKTVRNAIYYLLARLVDCFMHLDCVLYEACDWREWRVEI
jgi:hypothetical protein